MVVKDKLLLDFVYNTACNKRSFECLQHCSMLTPIDSLYKQKMMTGASSVLTSARAELVVWLQKDCRMSL